jgi:hypothetical protein
LKVKIKYTDMIPDKVLYTDGHDVVITESTFQVKNKSYHLNGITKHGLQTLHPDRAPGIIVFVLGAIISVCGILKLIPATWMESVHVNGTYFSINTIAMWTGLAIALMGILITSLVKEKYAVRIATAEGEKNAVISDKKEYIRQIVNALNEAYGFVRVNMGSTYVAPAMK